MFISGRSEVRRGTWSASNKSVRCAAIIAADNRDPIRKRKTRGTGRLVRSKNSLFACATLQPANPRTSRVCKYLLASNRLVSARSRLGGRLSFDFEARSRQVIPGNSQIEAGTLFIREFALADEIYTNVKCVLVEPGRPFPVASRLLSVPPAPHRNCRLFISGSGQAFISQVTREIADR